MVCAGCAVFAIMACPALLLIWLQCYFRSRSFMQPFFSDGALPAPTIGMKSPTRFSVTAHFLSTFHLTGQLQIVFDVILKIVRIDKVVARVIRWVNINQLHLAGIAFFAKASILPDCRPQSSGFASFPNRRFPLRKAVAYPWTGSTPVVVHDVCRAS